MVNLAVDHRFDFEATDELEEWRSLLRSIELAKGFKIFLVSCESEVALFLANELQHHFSSGLERIELVYPVYNLYQEVARRVSREETRAVLVLGLEHSFSDTKKRNRFLFQANIHRDNLAGRLPFPLILFLPEGSVSALSKEAPDFFSIRSGLYCFTRSLVKKLEQVPEKKRGMLAAPLNSAFQKLRDGGDQGQNALKILSRVCNLAMGISIPMNFLRSFEDFDDAALQALVELGLLKKISESLIRVHPLVGAYTEEKLGVESEKPNVEKILISQVDPRLSSGDSRDMEHWAPHLAHLAKNAMDRRDRGAALLCGMYGFYLYQVGSYREAEPFIELASGILESGGDKEKPLFAWCLNLYAMLLRAMGRSAEAEPMIRHALDIQKNAPIPDSLVAGHLNNLATVLLDLDRLDEAEPLFRQALSIEEKFFGSDHPRVGETLGNLANLLTRTGRASEAVSLLRRSLVIIEKILGPDHPSVAVENANLANALVKIGRLEEAEKLLRRAIALDEAALGHGHPDLSIKLNNLALLLADLGRVEEGIPLMEQSLAIFEQSLGGGHPMTKDARTNLDRLMTSRKSA